MIYLYIIFIKKGLTFLYICGIIITVKEIKQNPLQKSITQNADKVKHKIRLDKLSGKKVKLKYGGKTV